jgi:serine O-acetyltransferase
VVCGAEIDLNCNIGGGLLMPHPNGIVIHPKAIIGLNCLIFHQVTLVGIVKLGFHVDIGAGAKL